MGGLDQVARLGDPQKVQKSSGLVDELQLYINPTAVGRGRRLFDTPTALSLIGSRAYALGIAVTRYAPVVSS